MKTTTYKKSSDRYARFAAVSAFALTTLIGSAQASINLVQNGSFETTTLSTSGQISPTDLSNWSSTTACPGCYNFVYFNGQATPPAVGAADPSDPSNPHVWLYGNPMATDGSKYVALDGDPLYRAALTQTITGLTMGATYDLTFDWGAGQYTTRTGATQSRLEVSLGTTTQNTAFISDPAQSFTGWQHVDLQFVATGSSEVLSFLADGTPSGQPPVSLLDNVSLTQTPEPGYQALMFVGLGLMIGLVRLRRKSSPTTV